jgi:Flp pilus assembly protein TadG
MSRNRARSVFGRTRDRGAVAVEFALVFVFVLLPLILGIIDFGRMWFAQVTLTQSAREGARLEALNTTAGAANVYTGTTSSAASIGSIHVLVGNTEYTNDASIPPCTSGQDAVVKTTYTTNFLLFGQKTLSGKGFMLCGG